MICAYSIEDIDQAFSTSKLRGYSSSFVGNRPGTVGRKRPGQRDRDIEREREIERGGDRERGGARERGRYIERGR